MAQLQTHMMAGISASIFSFKDRSCWVTLWPKWKHTVRRVSLLPAFACSLVVKLSLPAMANMAVQFGMIFSSLYLPLITIFSPARAKGRN